MAANKVSTSKNRKKDEQVLYIDQTEDITTIRERLTQVGARCVILVIPAQTQLRSHVSWRLLSRRARELGKEVSVVSKDEQIRAQAQSVQFKAIPILPEAV